MRDLTFLAKLAYGRTLSHQRGGAKALDGWASGVRDAPRGALIEKSFVDNDLSIIF